METGTLVARAREDNSFHVKVSVGFLVVCLGVLGWSVPYLYNVVAGPFEFDPNAESQGWHSFIRAEGDLEQTGVVQQKSTKVFKVVTVKKETSAEYMTVDVGGRMLVVKVPPQFSGRVVEGSLEELPSAVSGMLQPAPLHDALLDATVSYRTSWKMMLFVVALLLLVPLALWTRNSLRAASSPENHAALRGLQKFGTPQEMIARIEREFRDAGEAAHAGRWWVGNTWFVRTAPFLTIHHASNLVGVGLKRTAKDNTVTYKLITWERGNGSADEDSVEFEEGNAVMERVKQHMAWAMVEDPEAFGTRWKSDREGLERDADARRSSLTAAKG